MKSNPITTSPDTSVADAAKKMAEEHVGSLLITEGDQLKGIFTERDLLNKVVATGKSPESLTVAEAGTLNIVTVEENTHVKDCAKILKERGFRHLPVVDANGNVLGIISSRDFFEHIADEMEGILDKMRDNKEAIKEDVDLYELIGLPTSAI